MNAQTNVAPTPLSDQFAINNVWISKIGFAHGWKWIEMFYVANAAL